MDDNEIHRVGGGVESVCSFWLWRLGVFFGSKRKALFFLVFGMEHGENIMVILAPRNYGGHKSPQMSLVVPRCRVDDCIVGGGYSQIESYINLLHRSYMVLHGPT